MKWSSVVAGAGVIVLAACSGSTTTTVGTPSTTIGITTTSAPSTSTSTATTVAPTTIAPSVASDPPDLINSGADYAAIWASLQGWRDWLFAHPDPDALETIIDPDCPCFAEDRLLLEGLVESDWRFEGYVYILESVELVTQSSASRVVLSVEDSRPPWTIVRSDGTVQQTLEGWGSQRWLVSLLMNEEGLWRIVSYAAAGG